MRWILLFVAVLPVPGKCQLEDRPIAEWNKAAVPVRNLSPSWRQEVEHRRWDRPWLERANAVVHYEQLLPVFERLNEGKPLVVLGLGSSIVATHGGCFNNRSQLYRHVSHVREHLNAEICEPHGWMGSFMGELNRSWPHADHIYINLGQPGGDIAQYARHWCFAGTLPKEVDLVVIEDHGGSKWWGEKGAHVEQIFVQLAHKGREGRAPAFVFVTTMFVVDIWHEEWKTPVPSERFEECLKSRCSNASLCADYATSLLTKKTGSTFGSAGEDSFSAVMHWYGFSVLSIRNAFVSALRDRAWGMSDCVLSWLFYQDSIHPSPAGVLFYADVLLNHFHAGLAWYKQVVAGNASNHARAVPQASVNDEAWDIPLRRCFSVETSAGLPVDASRTHGWAWAEERRPGHVTKPGWLTTQAGAVLTMKLSTLIHPRGAALAATLTLTYLASYDAMGMATLRCEGLCRCLPMQINAHHASHASVEAYAAINVTQTRECELTLSNDSPAGLKWKLLGLSVEARTDPRYPRQNQSLRTAYF